MNREQALKEFVIKHIKLLTSQEFNRREFKAKVRDFFFTQHSNKFGQPTNRDLMVALIGILKSTKKDEEIQGLIETLPFFRETGENERSKLHDLLSKKQIKSVLNDEQLKAIKEVGAYEAVARQKGKEIEEQKQSELVEIQLKIHAKWDEYHSLPSILEEEEIPEPNFNPEIEDIKPWWERFYLRGDPFPLKDGLSAISKDLYEAVIIKTEPFQKTLSQIQRNSDFLFHSGFLLVGDYGYGKTTFIDYLSNYLINNDVLPIRITSAKPYADSSGFSDSFLQKLRTELMTEASKMTVVGHRELDSVDIENQVVELCRKVLSARRKGVVVFMDDYHKFRSHFP